jgi:Uma2 family endonuclease
MVTLVQQQSLTFDKFLVRYGDDDRYELIDGELFDLEPTGPQEEVISNWPNDYARKFEDYALLGISE